MKTEIEQIGDVTILTLKGELDSRGNAHVDRVLRELCDKEFYKIILDVSAIRFIGNQTISMLLSNMKEMRAGGGDIRLLRPERSVLQYLKKNRMIELFYIYTAKSDAVKSFETFDQLETESNNLLRKTKSNKHSTNSKAYFSGELKPIINKIDHDESTFDSDSGGMLYANSCMLVALIKLLQNKDVLTTEEARELLDYEKLSLKGFFE